MGSWGVHRLPDSAHMGQGGSIFRGNDGIIQLLIAG